MTKLRKFTPLPSKQIETIVSNIPPELYHIAQVTQRLLSSNQKYKDLVRDFCAAADKKKFIEENVKLIAFFLNEDGLAGFLDEKNDFLEKPVGIGDFLITSDGAGLILAYLRSKPQNAKAHQMQSVRNTNLVTQNDSRKPSNIFIEQNAILDNFRDQVVADLTNAGDSDFSKTYLVEIFGTNGGDHIASVTIHKRAGEREPIVHLFDSSPAIIRNGFEAATNSVANGWCTQLFINATLKKAFADCDLVLKNENFFNNSEPLQKPGSSYCTSFATEMAVRIAGLDREEHIAMLRKKYKYPSPYGGMTEMPIDVERIKETIYVMDPDLALDADEVFLSHFTDTALKSRAEALAKVEHFKKDRSTESALKRIARYQSEDGINQMVEQKVGRQKWGHLFEIVTSEEFLAKADEAVMPEPLPLVRGTPFFPQFNEFERPQNQDQENLVEAFNKLGPRFNRVTKVNFDQERNELTVTVYLGAITAEKMRQFMEARNIKTDIQEIDMSDCFVGADSNVSKFYRVDTIVPIDRFADLTEAMTKNGCLVQAGNHPFMPQTSTTPISVDAVERDSKLTRT